MFAEFGPRCDALARDQLFLRSIYDSKATFLGRSDEDRFILRNASRQSPMGVRSVVSSSARICLKHTCLESASPLTFVSPPIPLNRTLVLASSEVKTDTGRPENRGRRDSRPARGPNNPNGQRGPRREGAGGGGSRTFNRGNSGGGNGGTVLKLTNPRKLVRVVEQEPLTEEERKEALDNFKERPASRGSDRPQRPVASAGEGGPAGASELNAPYDTGRYAQGGLGCEAVPFEVDDILPWLYCFVEFRCHDVGFFLPSSLGFVACEPSVAFDGIPSFHRVPVVLCDPLRGVV